MLLRTLVLFTMIFIAGCDETEVRFTPSVECEQGIIKLIDTADTSIDAAVYSISNDNIVNALYRAHNRGVKLRILTDRLQASGKYSKVPEMYKSGLNVKVNTANKIEHNKFAVFDGAKVVTGSYNWTTSATKSNSENCLFILQKSDSVADYQDRFNELWQKNSSVKSDKWLKKRLEKQFQE